MIPANGNLDERYPQLFAPHTILPAQFFTGERRWRARNSEQRLMFAILEDAISIYVNYREPSTSKKRCVFRETQRWFRSNDRTWVFSFLRICEVLDLDSDTIRRRVRLMRDKATDATAGQPMTVGRPAEAAPGCETRVAV